VLVPSLLLLPQLQQQVAHLLLVVWLRVHLDPWQRWQHFRLVLPRSGLVQGRFGVVLPESDRVHLLQDILLGAVILLVLHADDVPQPVLIDVAEPWVSDHLVVSGLGLVVGPGQFVLPGAVVLGNLDGLQQVHRRCPRLGHHSLLPLPPFLSQPQQLPRRWALTCIELQAKFDQSSQPFGVIRWDFRVHSLHHLAEESLHASGSKGRFERA
jgi:hypothetical protein